MSPKDSLPTGDSALGETPARGRSTRRLPVRLILVVFFAVTAASVLSVHRSLSSKSSRAVPFYAERVLAECNALEELPGPPTGFHNRSESDRFEHGTRPTVIVNATIWTGDDGGKQVLHGGSILLDKGILKYVGMSIPDKLLASLGQSANFVNAKRAWVTPAIVDIHNHAGVSSLPSLAGSDDGNSLQGIAQPWLRSIDGIDTHDLSYELSRAGGVGSGLILPGSADAIGGQAFMIKMRATNERSVQSMLLEPPSNIAVNETHQGVASPPRWRHIKHAAGENPSGVYAGTRMDTIWKFREAYNEARKVKLLQDSYCAKAKAGEWSSLSDTLPTDLKWEALVDVLRGKVKVNVHIYETVDFTGIVGLSNEFKFPIAAFHHAHEAYLVPEVIKSAYGETPAVAIFATFARYKKESYRGSEYAAKILNDNGIRVAMKSDSPFPIHSRFLLYEAAQAHYYGLNEISALQSVTTVPADVSGLGHRIGYLKKSWDADVVLWDSHPLALGAIPQQVWIDGIPQLSGSALIQKPDSLQTAPHTPNFAKEAELAVRYDGLPPSDSGNRVTNRRVAFTNVKELWMKSSSGEIISNFTAEAGLEKANAKSSLQTVVVENGEITCVSGSSFDSCVDMISSPNIEVLDLAGGSISPAMTSYGSELGLVDIVLDMTTGDGNVHDPVGAASTNSLLEGIEVRAADGLVFASRNAFLAYRSGVTSAIAAPVSGGFFHGISAAFSTSAKDKLDEGALLKEAVALHVSIVHYDAVSVSTQIALLRKGLQGGFGGERGKWFGEVAKGALPLAIEVERADYIVNILALKREIEASSSAKLRFILLGASEAHLVADHIAKAGVSVVLLPARQYPLAWDQARALPGPPLTPESSLEVLLRAAKEFAGGNDAAGEPQMRVGLGVHGVLGGWVVRNTRFDVGWAALASNGTISRSKALSLASSEIENIFGVEPSGDLVAYHGGDFSQFESKVAAVISPKLKYVDLL